MPPQSSKWDQYATSPATASKWDKFAVPEPVATKPPEFGTEAAQKATGIGPQQSHGWLTDKLQSAEDWVRQKATTGSQAGAGEFMASAPLGVLQAAKGGSQLATEPSAGMANIAKGVSTAYTMPAAAEAGGMIDTAAALPGAIRKGVPKLIDKLAGVPGAIAKEEGAAAATRAGNVSKFRAVEQSTKESQEAARAANIAKYKETEQATKEAQAAAKAKNISTYREAEQHLAAKQAEVAEANRADRETYQQAKKAAIDEQAKQQTITARKDNLAKASEQIKPAIQNHLTNVKDAVFDDLNQQWDKIREAVGDGITANPQSLTNSAKNALDAVTDVNKDLFNKVLGNSFGGAKPTELNWQEIQAAYTNLGKRLAQGGLPGDVWRSLRSFQEGLGTEMESMANAAGVKNELGAVKKNWSQAMADWMDTSKPIAKGGSPLAHATAKADPAGVAKVFEGPLTGPANRALKILGRYQRYGADVGYPLRYRSILDEAETLPKSKGVKMPTEPTPRPTPEMTSAPYKPGPADSNVSAYKPGPSDPNVAAYTPHPVDKAAIRAEQVGKLKKKAGVATLPIGGALGYELIHRLFGGSTDVAPH